MPTNNFEMLPVRSSNLEKIGYDSTTKTMAIKFKGTGRTYHYEGVDPDDFQALAEANSVGKHFLQAIKGKYKGAPEDMPKEGQPIAAE